MKLVQEKEHHLPIDPDERPSFLVTLIQKLLYRILSVKGLTVAIGAVLFALLSVTLSLNYLDTSQNVDPNGVSLKDFYADSRLVVEDREETRRKIDRARQNVPIIHESLEPHTQAILASTTDLLNDLGKLAVNKTGTDAARLARFRDLFDNSAEVELIYNRFFKEEMNPEHWTRIRLITLDSLRKILKKGLSLNDYLDNRNKIIQEALPRYSINRNDADLIYFLVENTLQPNLIPDEQAMALMRKRAESQVEPVTRSYNPGEKIVGRGEVVTPVEVAALQQMGKSVNSRNWMAGFGVSLLSLMLVFTVWAFLYNFREGRFFRPAYAGLILTLVLVTSMLLQVQISQTSGLSGVPLYAFPMATFALTLSVFTHYRVSIMATILLLFTLGLALQVDVDDLSVLLFGSMMGVYALSRRLTFSDRGQLMHAGLYIGCTNALVIMVVSLLEPGFTVEEQGLHLLTLVIWGFAGGILSAVLTIGILPILESLFRLVTPYTLMELGNHDKPLLKRMQFEAPGTFHHSLMVASLAEAAAEAIGADPLLTRVGCLYHDIGKMKRPLFFIENQAYFGVENPHDKLTPRLSKMVITAHPRDSLEMARQYKLPEVLMKFMTEHHGTMTAGYFYNKACLEEGVENVNKSQFRYPGPKPNIKETAIVMLADACESAVRALKAPTVGQIEERIDKIIRQRIDEGQFDNCPITFKDIHAIRETFVRVIRGIQHSRIEYQQNMMRELGRKLPPNQPQAQAKLETALSQIKTLNDKHHQQQTGNGAGSTPPVDTTITPAASQDGDGANV